MIILLDKIIILFWGVGGANTFLFFWSSKFFSFVTLVSFVTFLSFFTLATFVTFVSFFTLATFVSCYLYYIVTFITFNSFVTFIIVTRISIKED